MAKPSELLEDVEFVRGEIARVQTLIAAEGFKSLKGLEALCMIPHPAQGSVIIGRAGEQRLYELASKLLSASAFQGRIELKNLVKALRPIVAQLIYSDQPIASQPFHKLLASAVKQAGKACRDRRHFFPAHLMHLGEPEPFTVGPVTFWPSAQFREHYRDAWEAMVARNMEGGRPEDRARSLADDVLGYYAAFGWVADVQVLGCDLEISERRARQTADAGIDVIRLMAEDRNTRRMTIGGPVVGKALEAHLSLEPNAAPAWSLRGTPTSEVGFDGWIEWLKQPANMFVLNAAGRCIETFAEPQLDLPVAGRWVDALTWYGQAVRDRSDGAAVVKFVSAMERTVMTGEKGADRVYATFCARAGALLYEAGGDYAASKAAAAKIYDVRSSLVHGSLSPFAPEVSAARFQAATISRRVLINGLAALRDLNVLEDQLSTKQLGTFWDRIANDVEAGGSMVSART